MHKNKSVDAFISKKSKWTDTLVLLRSIVISTGLEETIKWGMPTYTIKGKNILCLVAFSSYAGIWFYQGVFLEDKAKVLVNAQEGKTKAQRQWRFTDFDQIDKELVKEYVLEAITNHKEGKEIKPQKTKPLEIPESLATAFSLDPKLKEAFDTLKPFKQREYLEYLQSAKREMTKQKRLEKIIPILLQGIGLGDKYR